MRSFALSAILASVASLAAADTVILKNGGRLEGVETKLEDGKLVVTLQNGTVRFNREDVAKVIHRVTPMEEYRDAAAKVKKDDAKAHFELANWCAEKELGHFERVELEATIAADPDHAEARARLGYEKVGGQWLRGEALLKARGMVKVDGKWVTKEAAHAAAAEKEKRRLDKALAEAARKAKAAEKDEEMERLREFYDSMQRVRTRTWRRDDDFDSRRAPRAYPRRYWYDYGTPYDYSEVRSGGYYYRPGVYYVGAVGGYSPGCYTGYYGYPYYGGSSVGIRYTSRSGRYSVRFGTSFYGYGWGYYPYGYYGGYGSSGRYVPGSGGTSPGYYSSPGAFDRGGLAPGYGGYR